VFALGVGSGFGLPDGWQIVHQVEDALALRFADVARCGRCLLRVVAFELIKNRQFLIPVALQAASNEALFGLHLFIAPPSPFRLIVSPLDAQLPLVINGAGLSFEMLDGL
jgi:hypothetical protein